MFCRIVSKNKGIVKSVVLKIEPIGFRQKLDIGGEEGGTTKPLSRLS